MAKSHLKEGDPQAKDLTKIISQILDESDFKSDEDRKDIHVWNNEVEMAKNEGLLSKLKQAKTKEDFIELSKHISVGVWYGDFYSPNDGYPLGMSTK